jgi:hypothetical protein
MSLTHEHGIDLHSVGKSALTLATLVGVENIFE